MSAKEETSDWEVLYRECVNGKHAFKGVIIPWIHSPVDCSYFHDAEREADESLTKKIQHDIVRKL